MKKKIKLFTTIASLCLAVALMAFGVYAASQVTYNVNGTVKYSMEHVLVSVSTTIEKTNELAAPENLEEATLENHGSYADAGLLDEGEGTYATYNEDQTVNSENDEVTVEGIVYDFSVASVYKLTVTVDNINPNGIQFTAAGLTAAVAEDANYAVVASASNTALNTKVDKGSTATFTFYIAIKDVTVSIAETATNFQFVAKQAA